MANPSNLYAEKIFSEHPLALWALDDQIDYISLITEPQRHIESWTKTGGTAENNTSVIDEPFTSSAVTRVVGNTPSTVYGQVKLVSPNIKNFSDLDQGLETFSIGTYVYADNESASSYDIGYEYTNGSGQVVENVKTFQTSIINKWMFISETFKIPAGVSANIRLVIKLNYLNIGTPPNGYGFYVNGISFGQWSEEFAPTSLGGSVTALPSDLLYLGAGSTPYGVPAKAYGLDVYQGYYMSGSNSFFAKNSGTPMVYGASNTTIISPNTNSSPTTAYPSLVIPGHGFLNNSGRYNHYTVEFWIRLENFSSEPLRIFGPTKTNTAGWEDGIYVDGPFVKIKIGNSTASHFVGDWSRPMLFDFKLGDGVAGLMINGEQVISMPIDIASIELPDELYPKITQDGVPQNKNWLGFYAHEAIPSIEIDGVAVYSYQVSSILAKRRFVYGQGVDFPEGSNTAYGGTSIFIDYPFASYTNNYSYPEVGKFRSGIVDNATITSGSISSPQYNLPEIIFEDSSTTITDWNSYNKDLSDSVGSNVLSFNESPGYLLFNKLNILNDSVKAIYGMFKSYDYPTEKQTLIRIQNTMTGDYFSSYILNSQIFYELKFGQETVQLYSEGDFVKDNLMFSGIDIDAVSSYYGGNVSSFFGNRNQLMVLIAGNQDLSEMFSGEIYKVGFSTSRNFNYIKKYFNSVFSGVSEYDAGSAYYKSDSSFWSNTLDGGSTSSSFPEDLLGHTASYTLITSDNYGQFGLDIATSSYWEDYVPLSYLSQYVTDEFGDKTYDLDFIQFNIDYPATPVYSGESYDTSSSLVKTYVTFKYNSEATVNFENRYIRSIPAPKNGVVEPGTYVVGNTESIVRIDGLDVTVNTPIYDDFYNTRYEVVDGTVIYPPAGININNILMSMHVKIETPGTGYSNLIIKKLQLASEAFNGNSLNPIGTRFGSNIYPYRKYGSYYDYMSRNPFRIYKGSTPYLYLTRDSGIQKVGSLTNSNNSGLSIPINQSVAQEYKAIAMQKAIRFNLDKFDQTPVQIFEIEGKNIYIKFYVVANDFSGKRGRIYAVNSTTGQVENGITFYLNGKLVREPVVSLNSWSFLGINFQKSIDFDNFVGALRITGPIVSNVISIYKSTNLQEVQKNLYRSWERVRATISGSLDWLYWKSNPPYSWNGVLVAASLDYYGVDPSTIYKTYTGTNKIILDDTRQIRVSGYEYGIYNYGSTVAKIINPV